MPYKGSSPALTDLMGGQVQMMFDSMTSSLSFVKAGKLTITQKLNAIGAEPVISTPADFSRFVVKEKDSWGAIARESGATMN
ncbi:Tripartite tricarboxylate transporter family receptor [Mycobacteroides abscessus subsp. abscessus]|nr:Tripartite tricarboxylate transporter family receptor [Mycobacteroides abscessus subsp. abscessus]